MQRVIIACIYSHVHSMRTVSDGSGGWGSLRKQFVDPSMNSFGGDRSVYVTVDGTRRIVNGLDWKTTAHDVIQSLRPRSGPQVLLESWRGCARPIQKDEYVCRILEEWGEEARHVQLILMSAYSIQGYSRGKPGLDRARIYKAQRHGKVASNKRRCVSRLSTPKKKIVDEIERLVERARAARERLDAAQIQQTTLAVPESPSLDLSPSEDEEWVALQEHLAEEEQEGRELEGRRKEIRDRIQEQSTEIEQLKKGNAEQQAKLSVEQERLKRLSGDGESRVLEEARSQVERLQSELKVRMKLNQLQSTKMQELSASISTMEQDIGNCVLETEALNSTR